MSSNFAGQSSVINKRGRGQRSGRNGGQFGGRCRGRRSPPCQLCRSNGHFATSCPQLSSFANQARGDRDISSAFNAQCNLSPDVPDCFVDSGATDHMSSITDALSQQMPYSGQKNEAHSRSRSV